MNNGILTQAQRAVPMPYGLLGRPTPVPMPHQALMLDPDSADYIRRVEAADGQELELSVRLAFNAFVVGCKADGIWSAIKASCILAGARTLKGALVPLVGAAPTNNGPFVQGDYDRKTGLAGNGSTKYLNSNRNNNADPQNSNHNAVYVTAAQTTGVGLYMATTTSTGGNNLGQNTSPQEVFFRSRNSSSAAVYAGTFTGFLGHSRNSSTGLFVRLGSTTYSESMVSQTPLNENINIYRRGTTNYADARIAFYSIGEHLALALLDARVTTLINALGAAIP